MELVKLYHQRAAQYFELAATSPSEGNRHAFRQIAEMWAEMARDRERMIRSGVKPPPMDDPTKLN